MLTLLIAVLIVLIGPFLAGLRAHPLAAWALIVAPLLIGFVVHVEEPPQSDQTHLAVGLGLIASGIAVVAWLTGWLIRALRTRDEEAQRPGP